MCCRRGSSRSAHSSTFKRARGVMGGEGRGGRDGGEVKDHCPSSLPCRSRLSRPYQTLCALCASAATFLTVLLLIVPRGIAEQDPHAAHAMPPLPRELIERPLPLRPGIGAAHDAVSTREPQAQEYYDQGLAYLHSFMWIEAARSFHQALRLDSMLAMADVGLSYAYVELNAPAEAKASLDRARSRAASASEHDRCHVELRAAQMAAEAAL